MTTNRMMRVKASMARLRIALLEVLFSTLVGMILDRYFATGPSLAFVGFAIGLVIAAQHWMSVSNAHRQQEVLNPGSSQQVRVRAKRGNASGRRVEEESIY